MEEGLGAVSFRESRFSRFTRARPPQMGQWPFVAAVIWRQSSQSVARDSGMDSIMTLVSVILLPMEACAVRRWKASFVPGRFRLI